jgi:hypothetical protein
VSALLCALLCLSLSACQTDQPAVSDTSTASAASSDASTPADDTDPLAFSVQVEDGRTLTLVPEGDAGKYDMFCVQQLLVYDGETLLQTIDPATLHPDENYLFEGLFLPLADEDGPVSDSAQTRADSPIVQDLNFDGAEDFGLFAASTYPQNLPYCFFLWNSEEDRFDYSFMLFPDLEVDEHNQQLIEHSYDSQLYESRYYYYDPYAPNGTLQLFRRVESQYGLAADQVQVTTYELSGDQLVQTSQSLQPIPVDVWVPVSQQLAQSGLGDFAYLHRPSVTLAFSQAQGQRTLMVPSGTGRI